MARQIITLSETDPAGWGQVPTLGGDVATSVPDPVTGVSETQDQQVAITATQNIAQTIVIPPAPYAVINRIDPSGALTIWFQTLIRKLGGYVATPTDDAQILAYEPETVDQQARGELAALMAGLDSPRVAPPVAVDPWGGDTSLQGWVKGLSYQPQPANSITKMTTGFTDPANVIVTYDSAAQTVTLTGNVSAYYQGVKVPQLVSGWVSAAHSTTNATYFLYWDGSAFVWSTTPWTFSELMICFVNYGATYKWALRETHGMMDYASHEEFHRTIGTYLETGGVLSGYTPASTTAADRRPGISAATVHDEDLETVIPLLADNGPYTQVTLTGAAVNVFTAAAAEIVPVLVNNPYYNSFTTPNWGQTLMANNTFMCVWCVAVPVTADAGSQAYRYLWIQGQSNGTLAAQQALAFSSLNLGTMATQFTEFTAIAKVIIRYTGGNWDIVSVDRLLGTKVQSVTMAGSVTSVFANAPILGTGTAADPLTMSSTISVVAGATLTAGQWCNLYNVAGTATVRPADSTDATKPVHGFVLADCASAATATVYLAGANTVIPVGTYVAADVGKPVFLGTAGATTLTPPATTGNLLQQVGWVDAVGTTVTVSLINSPGIVRA